VNEFRKYTVIDYQIFNEFYIFIDIYDGVERKLHKDFYKGEEVIK
jgi:hypothetical protein